MLREDWLGGAIRSHMRRQFKSIGEAIEDRTGKQYFAVDAVIGQKGDVLDVKAGRIASVEKATWPLAGKPKTGPWKKFQPMCMPIDSQSRPVAR